MPSLLAGGTEDPPPKRRVGRRPTRGGNCVQGMALREVVRVREPVRASLGTRNCRALRRAGSLTKAEDGAEALSP